MIKGKNGIFDVHMDGELIFSKHQTFRFPEPGEVEGEIRRRLDAA